MGNRDKGKGDNEVKDNDMRKDGCTRIAHERIPL
jgi:hypothetical protein